MSSNHFLCIGTNVLFFIALTIILCYTDFMNDERYIGNESPSGRDLFPVLL